VHRSRPKVTTRESIERRLGSGDCWCRKPLDRQRLYRYRTSPSTDIDELLKHKLRPELITPYWDELLRLAASLRHGWAPASLLLTRLHAGSRRNPLARALQEYGRLIKNFVLAWLVDEELRRRVGRQLNKGEQLHALRRFLFYANEGHVRHRTPEQQTGQAICLSVVVNAIIVWNTVYTQRILNQLRADGQLITTSEIEQISPLPHQHINAYGHHTFNLASRPTGYRPLRTPQQVVPPAAETLNRV
jgi:TnpA family transposase